ncbi:hypothetical protein [Brevundimonas sp.]|uniref:hypothetical protein n=1 Tax=Brevundimonas sp. TaxID=1871086 RepID=UPI0028962FC8|nr:hypothetical protein [Brevundimonas sp.]
MNTNTKRMVLAAIAAFYVVVGGLWSTHYFPLKKFEAQVERQSELIKEMGFDAAYESKEYNDAEAYQHHYVATTPSLDVTLGKMAFYKNLLFWGTIALAAGGGVLFLTRGRKSQPAQTGAQ